MVRARGFEGHVSDVVQFVRVVGGGESKIYDRHRGRGRLRYVRGRQVLTAANRCDNSGVGDCFEVHFQDLG